MSLNNFASIGVPSIISTLSPSCIIIVWTIKLDLATFGFNL